MFYAAEVRDRGIEEGGMKRRKLQISSMSISLTATPAFDSVISRSRISHHCKSQNGKERAGRRHRGDIDTVHGK
jgi:hypothetical protein